MVFISRLVKYNFVRVNKSTLTTRKCPSRRDMAEEYRSRNYALRFMNTAEHACSYYNGFRYESSILNWNRCRRTNIDRGTAHYLQKALWETMGYLCCLKFDNNVVNIVRIDFVDCKKTVYGLFNNRWKFQVMSFGVSVISERNNILTLKKIEFVLQANQWRRSGPSMIKN